MDYNRLIERLSAALEAIDAQLVVPGLDEALLGEPKAVASYPVRQAALVTLPSGRMELMN